MIYGKIWCVVKPTVGIPLFLGSVAATSLFVHYQLLGATGWMQKYYQGAHTTKAAAVEAPADKAALPAADKVALAPK